MTPAIIATPDSVAKIFEQQRLKFGNVPLIAISGAFDALHYGHIRYILNSSLLKGENGLLVAIVNGDNFLLRKKGYVFMPLEERMEMVAGIKGIDYVVPWDDGTQYVSEALKIIKPKIFAKGGARFNASNIPENETCQQIGCAVVFGIGGTEKIQSSSALVNRYQNPRKKSIKKS